MRPSIHSHAFVTEAPDCEPSPQCNERSTYPSALRAPDKTVPYSWESCSKRTIERGGILRAEHADALTSAASEGKGWDACVELLDGCTTEIARTHVAEVEKMFKKIDGEQLQKQEL